MGFISDSLSVDVEGMGPDVLLIPGFASSREVWRAEAERLKGSHRVHLVQLAGFAGEPWTRGDGPFLVPAVDELARYIKVRGLKRPAVIGHSLGGTVALMLSQRHPASVGRVMTVDSLPFLGALFDPKATVETSRGFADQAAAEIQGSSDAQFRASQARTAANYTKDASMQARLIEWSAAGHRKAMASALRDLMLTDLRPALSSVKVPVWAVYAADAQGGTPPHVADATWVREYAGLAGVRFLRIDGSRHFIMSDQPERLTAITREFLDEGRQSAPAARR